MASVFISVFSFARKQAHDMDWSLFWTAFGSIGTMLACIIALFQPIIERHIEYRRRLKLSMRIDMVAMYPDDTNEYFCEVNIVNQSHINLYIHNVSLLVEGQYLQQFCLPNNPIYVNHLPYELKIGEKYSVNFSKTELKKVLKDAKNNSVIYIVASDSYGKIYKQKTKFTVADIKKGGK